MCDCVKWLRLKRWRNNRDIEILSSEIMDVGLKGEEIPPWINLPPPWLMKKGRGFLGEKGAESNINIHEWSMHINFFICVLKSVLNELLNRHHVYILFHKKKFSWGASFTEVHQTPYATPHTAVDIIWGQAGWLWWWRTQSHVETELRHSHSLPWKVFLYIDFYWKGTTNRDNRKLRNALESMDSS